jgi:transposase InsO family protein
VFRRGDNVLETRFLQVGHAARLYSDGGPHFRSEFNAYCKSKGMIHELTSPYCPQSNGLIEKLLGIVKAIMRKTKAKGSNLAENLSMLYNTPRQVGGHSPSCLFYSRQIRITNPPNLNTTRKKGSTEHKEE